MLNTRKLYVVHCIDTEGPLNETLTATFDRLDQIFGIRFAPTQENLESLQQSKIDLNGIEDAVAKCIAPELLKYNKNWGDIEKMLNLVMSDDFRNAQLDSQGKGWIYSWHCMDHMGFSENPRDKALGYGIIFNYYRKKLQESHQRDEINWHFHPLSLSRMSTHAATSYLNSFDIQLEILCRRILQDDWFPVVNRPGFHSERPDSHNFLEQWIPFDYANQYTDDISDQPDLQAGRFGDWRRAPATWRGYFPSHDDYQVRGNCRRLIFRCLNVGTRLRPLSYSHVIEAFEEADREGSAILSFSNHDWRDIKPDVDAVRSMIEKAKSEFPKVEIEYAGAEVAARAIIGRLNEPAPELSLNLVGNELTVSLNKGSIFGPQPFLAIETKLGQFYHDNLDFMEPGKSWSYVFDKQTIELCDIKQIGVGSAGRYGKFAIAKLSIQ